ncbi:sulfite exporter TauE/SafE family protein [Sphingobacterium suaedae]|uniref:Probable membrane transporter protein n=1 Tax=Sphingobacterium suaedae TaxID=1686402 RepID=A0ABW5KEK9_9SPHI
MILGYFLAIVVGITLGLVGSGGSILTVPILVYTMGVDPVLSTTYSLFAVGVTAVVGSLKGFYQGEVDLRKVVSFGIPSLLMVFVTRTFILPCIPEIFIIGDWEIHQATVLMIVFAVVMLASAWSMIKGHSFAFVEKHTARRFGSGQIVMHGMLVGLVTGVVGAGGGFLIIPALVHFYHMPMKNAVSTSLVIIAVNAGFGLLGDVEKLPTFDWQILGGYTGLAIGGIFVGFYLANKISGDQLKKLFGYMILLVGMYILVKELFLI